jgi:hypothetical protein
MGNESLCFVEFGSESAKAKALLETDALIVRGALRARIPFGEMKEVQAVKGALTFGWNDRDVRIHVGDDAAKWAEKIRNPKSVADKLGIKAGQRITVLGDLGSTFLEGRGANVSSRLRLETDIIFLAANDRKDLDRLPRLRESLAPAGAVWVIRPKGIESIRETDVMSSAKAAGLVDVKVVRFSDSHTAEKLVIPVAKR